MHEHTTLNVLKYKTVKKPMDYGLDHFVSIFLIELLKD